MRQALGNVLFFGSLGAGAFFGYYTARYTADQVETMVEQTKEPENSFPGSSVRPSRHEDQGVRPWVRGTPLGHESAADPGA